MKTRPRAALALLLTLVLTASLFVIPAMASSTATFTDTGRGMEISGRIGSNGSWQTNWAGEMKMQLDGGQTVNGFCIDIQTSISRGTSGLVEQGWSDSGISNLAEITYILNNYTADSGGLAGGPNTKAASIQAAIWHFSDDYNLRMTGNNNNSTELRNNYTQIVDAAKANGGGSTEPSPSLELSPATGTAYVGQPVGPFTVSTTGSDVALDVVPAGATVTSDENGTEISSVNDGDVFWINSNEPGEVTVSASVQATVEAGRVFFRQGFQRLILADSSTASSSDQVTATFDALPEAQPVAPEVDRSDECGVPDSFSVPETTGVQYLVNGDPVSTGDEFTGPESGSTEFTITAEAKPGFSLHDENWSTTIILEAGEPCPDEVTPVTPSVDASGECDEPETFTIPDTDGVDYYVNGTYAAPGTVFAGPSVTDEEESAEFVLTAQPSDAGYQLADPDWTVTLTLEAGEPCPDEVAPVEPTVNASQECEQPESLTIPTTEGLEYHVDGVDRSGDTISGPGEITVTVVAQDGYENTGDREFTFDLAAGEPCPDEVSPVAPRVQVSEVCDEPDRLVVPDEAEGYRYLDSEGNDVSGTTIDGPGSVTITAEAEPGFVIDGDSEFTFELADGDTCTQAVTPTLNPSEACDQPDTLTIPETDGLEYHVNGEDVSGQTLEGPGEITVTVVTNDGYDNTGDDEFTFDLADGDTCTEGVSPSVTTADECDVPDSLTIPDTEGVQYLLNGDAIPAGATVHGPSSGTTEHVLTAVAEEGYELEDPEWSYSFELTAGEPCPEPVVVVAATILAECVEDESAAVTVTLDNSDSEEEVTYVVTIDGEETEVSVVAGESATVEGNVAAGTGEFDVDVEVAGETLVGGTFDTFPCEVEVGGVVIEAEEDDSTEGDSDVDEVETEVLPQVLEASGSQLPRTGVSAVLLMLLGLGGLLLGGTLVRKRS